MARQYNHIMDKNDILYLSIQSGGYWLITDVYDDACIHTTIHVVHTHIDNNNTSC